MKACVLYISRTGNTRRLAEAISELLNAPVYNIADAPEPSVANDFDLLVIGTPVMGLQPAPEVHSFVKRLPESAGKKTILFCTYAIKQGGTLKVLEKELATKGYINLKVSVSYVSSHHSVTVKIVGNFPDGIFHSFYPFISFIVEHGHI
jgi:flavodoxin